MFKRAFLTALFLVYFLSVKSQNQISDSVVEHINSYIVDKVIFECINDYVRSDDATSGEDKAHFESLKKQVDTSINNASNLDTFYAHLKLNKFESYSKIILEIKSLKISIKKIDVNYNTCVDSFIKGSKALNSKNFKSKLNEIKGKLQGNINSYVNYKSITTVTTGSNQKGTDTTKILNSETNQNEIAAKKNDGKLNILVILLSVAILLLLVFIIILIIINRDKIFDSSKRNSNRKVTGSEASGYTEFYMGLPTENGFLDQYRHEKFDQNRSVFKFIIYGHNKKKATYEIVTDVKMLYNIVKNNPRALSGFCNFVPSNITNESEFENILPGKVHLRRGKWIIEDEVKIELSSNKRKNTFKRESNDSQLLQPIKTHYVGKISDKNFPYHYPFNYAKPETQYIFDEFRDGFMTFRFYNNEEMLKLLTSEKSLSLIRYTCDNENAFSDEVIDYEVIEGEAKKTHNTVEITQKMKIRFIYKLKTSSPSKAKEEIKPEKSNISDQSISFVKPGEPEKFYMGMPEEKIFPGFLKTNKYKLGFTIFEFVHKNSNEVEFSIITDEETIKYIKDTYIDKFKPACILNNLPTIDTKRIVTKEPGKAKLVGADWEITKKATIEFE